MKVIIPTAVAAFATLLSLGACSLDVPETDYDLPAEGEPAAVDLTRCVEIDEAAWTKVLADGAREGTGMSFTGAAAAVRSEDYKKAYMIAAAFTFEGDDEEFVGVWTTNDLDPGDGVIVGVDPLAREFTVWGEGVDRFDLTDDGVAEAEGCLQL